MTIILLVVGLGLIVLGADWLVDGAMHISIFEDGVQNPRAEGDVLA